MIERPGSGIGYLDETLADRDEHGVLEDAAIRWTRAAQLVRELHDCVLLPGGAL